MKGWHIPRKSTSKFSALPIVTHKPHNHKPCSNWRLLVTILGFRKAPHSCTKSLLFLRFFCIIMYCMFTLSLHIESSDSMIELAIVKGIHWYKHTTYLSLTSSPLSMKTVCSFSIMDNMSTWKMARRTLDVMSENTYEGGKDRGGGDQRT